MSHTNITFFDNIAFSCTYIFNKNVIAGWINLLKKGAGTSTQQKSYIFLIIIFVQGLSFKKGAAAGVSVRASDKASSASKEGSLNLSMVSALLSKCFHFAGRTEELVVL